MAQIHKQKQYHIKIEKSVPIPSSEVDDAMNRKFMYHVDFDRIPQERYETIFQGGLSADEVIYLMRVLVEMRETNGGDK